MNETGEDKKVRGEALCTVGGKTEAYQPIIVRLKRDGTGEAQRCLSEESS